MVFDQAGIRSHKRVYVGYHCSMLAKDESFVNASNKYSKFLDQKVSDRNK